ncbi:MAG: copper homeostasis protein CutC [Spirosomataceae bacterium]
MVSIEICSYSLEDCLTAQRCGAHRVELCGGLLEGGTTPSAGLIAAVRAAINIELFVMIRPRGGDFLYSPSEIAVMERDIEIAKTLGADGVVLGLLHPDGRIDVAQTRRLVQLAQPMGVTFHRAFDMANDPLLALEEVIETGCIRILTSGQQNRALDGKDLLATLVQAAQERIEIMAGSGVSAQNASALLQTGVQALHLTGKSTRDSLMQFRNPALSMGGTVAPSEYELSYADEQKVAAVVALVQGISR